MRIREGWPAGWRLSYERGRICEGGMAGSRKKAGKATRPPGCIRKHGSTTDGRHIGKALGEGDLIPGVSALSRRWFVVDDRRLERTVFGLAFPNPVGMAAGA